MLEGEHVFQVGEQEFRTGPGGLVFAPRGVPHSQRRVVPRTGRVLIVTAPAGLEGFFRQLADADAAGRLGPDAYAAASERYGITWVGSEWTQVCSPADLGQTCPHGRKRGARQGGRLG
jgi:hypothetical protein